VEYISALVLDYDRVPLAISQRSQIDLSVVGMMGFKLHTPIRGLQHGNSYWDSPSYLP
jgi:hypothetical protein